MTLSLQTVGLITVVMVMIVIVFLWFKHGNTVIQSILFPIFTFALFYLNAPSFLVVPEGTEPVQFLKFPFSLYERFGLIYILISNILVTLLGNYLGNSRNSVKYSATQIKKKFDRFCVDATELRIIGRDLSFLSEKSYSTQREKIDKLKANTRIICEKSDDETTIDLYQSLLNDGIQIRSYTRRDGIANLKGQIKTTEQKQSEGLFVLKTPPADRPVFAHSNKKHILSSISLLLSGGLKRFQITEMSSGYLVDSVIQQFDRTFENAVHPTIRCIALDLGGVYLNGDIDTFYNYLKEKYSIVISKKKKDRLNIDNSMMLGEITIREFLSKNVPLPQKQALDEDDWSNILLNWQNTWTPNPSMKKLISDLSQFGYCVVPFSNLDKQNGDKYLRDHYLPSCCVYYYFSYEQKHSKPSKGTFIDYEKKLKMWGYNYKPFQILLIDDESANIAQARSRKWQTMQFYNDSPEAIKNLIKELKGRGILPNNYSLPERSLD